MILRFQIDAAAQRITSTAAPFPPPTDRTAARYSTEGSIGGRYCPSWPPTPKALAAAALKDVGTVIEQERGEQQDAIPLLDLFIGLLTSEERAFTDIRELAQAAAKVRRRAEKGLLSE